MTPTSTAGTSQGRDGLLAAGRDLPQLLFVTHRAALDQNIGGHGASEVLALIREANMRRPRERRHVIVEYLGDTPLNPSVGLREVHDTLREHPTVQGVVLLGGYDVVPAMRVDTLPPWLRTWVDHQPLDGDDADNWIVWCDDAYGDLDGHSERAGIPEIPVSRIPDGRSKELMLAALCTDAPAETSRSGIRNVRRPFAERVFALLPGTDEMHVSSPVRSSRLAKSALQASHVYIMLHGRNDIGRELWGEVNRVLSPNTMEMEVQERIETEAPIEITATLEHKMLESKDDEMISAVDYQRMPGDGATILSGCCWSAQAAKTSARRTRSGTVPQPRRTDTSVALASLRRGARAFVGSTGVNYSPIDPDDRFYCEPLHREFWHAVNANHPPAMALLIAKHRYASGMPHGHRNDYISLAIEHKTLHQYTCLGLGW